LDEVRDSLEVTEIQGQVKDYQVFHDALTIQRLGYMGPLGYPNSITVNISFREQVLLSPETRFLETLYFDPFPVTAMQLEEMVAEKLRAALMRKMPRDYFDLWLVLREEAVNTALVPNLLEAKLEAVGQAYDPSLFWQDWDVLERLWQEDLRELMPQVPEFEAMIGELKDGLPDLLPS
jgi:predicted nucleotidyltransferase component of viral defense system